MKDCKTCDDYTCGGMGMDHVSPTCGSTKSGKFEHGVEHFGTGAIREYKTGKGRCDLLPMCALIRLSKHFEEGVNTHGERNWENGIPMHSFLDSALRHLFKYIDGQTDEDHLCAAAWNIVCAMWTEEKRPEMQDIPTRPNCSATHILTEEQPKPENTTCGNWLDGNPPRCVGTKEIEQCECGGNRSKCDFYPHVRKVANEQSK